MKIFSSNICSYVNALVIIIYSLNVPSSNIRFQPFEIIFHKLDLPFIEIISSLKSLFLIDGSARYPACGRVGRVTDGGVSGLEFEPKARLLPLE